MKYLKKKEEVSENNNIKLIERVSEIIKNVRINGDHAIVDYNTKFDDNSDNNLLVTKEEIEAAYKLVDAELIEDIKFAAGNIEKFALKQKETVGSIKEYEVTEGVKLGQRVIPVQSSCCYVPGGGYPLFSSALMLVIPAKIAGVKRVAACSPVVKGTNQIHPATLVAMDIAGADEIYKVGGAHAIAGFSYGTKQIKKVDVIVGPGNQYVTEAKRQCYGQVGIDFIAGPSEVLIIAEKKGNPTYIAADILAQSEHDPLASGILVTTDEKLAKEVIAEVERQLETLETKKIAEYSWEKNGEIIIAENIEEAFEISNEIAPEHLEIHVENNDYAIENLYNYGSLFVGENSAEVFGDYVSGTNHTLPTLKASKYTGGVWVGTFLKICTIQEISKDGVKKIGKSAVRMAENEGLYGHANAARVRL